MVVFVVLQCRNFGIPILFSLPIKRKILVGTLCLYPLGEFVSCPSFPKPVFSWEAKGSGKAAEPEPSFSMMAKIVPILYGDFSYCCDGKFCHLQELKILILHSPDKNYEVNL